MKQKGGRRFLFGDQVHSRLASETVLTGLTIDSLVLLLKEHLSFIKKNGISNLHRKSFLKKSNLI